MLKSAFAWLDAHPAAYWVVAGLASAGLVLRVIAALRAEPPSALLPRSRRWLDPLVLLLFLLAWRWPFFLYAQQFNPDESQFIAGAITLAHDPVFWRAVDGTTSGPLNFYALLPIHWIGAPLDFFTARLAALLMVWGALWACLNLVRRHSDAAVAWLVLLPAAAFFATTTAPDFVHYSSEHVPVLLVALAAALLAGPETPRGWRLITGAVLAGATPWAKLQAGPIGAMLVLWAAWRLWTQPEAERPPWPALARLMAAALAPTLVIAAVSASADVAGTAWERYFTNNLVYFGKAEPVIIAYRAMLKLAVEDGRMPLFIGTFVVVALGAAICLVVRRVRPTTFVVFATLLALSAVFVVTAPRRGFLHYTLLLPVPLTILLGALVAPGWRTCTARSARLATALVLVATGLLAPLLSRARQPGPSMIGHLLDAWQHPRSADAELIRGFAPPGSSLAVWGWASYLHVETGLRQVTPDPNTVSLIMPHPNVEADRRRYVEAIIRADPPVFVDAIGPGGFALTDRGSAGHEIIPELADHIHSHYTEVVDLGHSRIYFRNGPNGWPAVSGAQIAAWLAKGREAPVNPSIAVDVATLTANISELSHHDVRGHSVTMIHPPCRLEWTIPSDAQTVTLEFGFDPKAVAEGSSNGAEVIVELVNSGSRRLLHRRFLDPQNNPADREPVNVTIPLPAFTSSSRLVLRTTPGPHGNAAWDWVYLGSLSFQQADQSQAK